MKATERDELLIRIDERTTATHEAVQKQNGRIRRLELIVAAILGGGGTIAVPKILPLIFGG